MHVVLRDIAVAVIAQRRTEVEVLHVRSGDLAVGEVLIPVELHTGVVLFHNECTHTEAGVVVIVVRDRVNGVATQLIRRTQGNADKVPPGAPAAPA